MINNTAKALTDGGYIATAVVASQAAITTAQKLSITDTRIWLGLEVPHWLGWLALLLALIFGSMISIHQETAVDKYIRNPKLKPFYSFGFGFFAAVFGIPLKYPNLNVFDLVIPALLLSAIGSQVIYYVVAFSSSPELWNEVKERLMTVVRGRKA